MTEALWTWAVACVSFVAGYILCALIMGRKEMIPNPGSDEALEQGCTCPVLDNGHGNEELGRIRGFVINLSCPLHGSS